MYDATIVKIPCELVVDENVPGFWLVWIKTLMVSTVHSVVLTIVASTESVPNRYVFHINHIYLICI